MLNNYLLQKVGLNGISTHHSGSPLDGAAVFTGWNEIFN
jgi:hypothetical protein